MRRDATQQCRDPRFGASSVETRESRSLGARSTHEAGTGNFAGSTRANPLPRKGRTFARIRGGPPSCFDPGTLDRVHSRCLDRAQAFVYMSCYLFKLICFVCVYHYV